MTTQIKITHEGPSKHEVRVRQMSGGVEVDRAILQPAESVVMNVYANHELNVQEGREIEHEVAETPAGVPQTASEIAERQLEVGAHGNATIAAAEGVELGDSAEVVHTPGHPAVVDDANASEASP